MSSSVKVPLDKSAHLYVLFFYYIIIYQLVLCFVLLLVHFPPLEFSLIWSIQFS